MAEELLVQNQQWAKDMIAEDKDFFKNIAKDPQTPKVLWIGCSDSRVPESVITASIPGVIFVQRNIANQFRLTDDNTVSVLEYAVGYLNVNHIVVCGHSQCGGCKAALEASLQPPTPPKNAVGRWIQPIIELVQNLNVNEVNDANLELVVRANVEAQVQQIEKVDVIREARADKRKVYIHGWEYKLDEGVLKDLGITIGPVQE